MDILHLPTVDFVEVPHLEVMRIMGECLNILLAESTIVDASSAPRYMSTLGGLSRVEITDEGDQQGELVS